MKLTQKIANLFKKKKKKKTEINNTKPSHGSSSREIECLYGPPSMFNKK